MILSELMYQAINRFHLPTEVKYYFDYYNILHWMGSWTAEEIIDGAIQNNFSGKENIKFIVVYDKCSMLSIANSKQVKLSFRRIRGQNYGYVIIRHIHDESIYHGK